MVEFRPIAVLLAHFISNSIKFIDADLNLTILHTNDVHCRFLSFNSQTRNCDQNDLKTNNCWGGAARRMTLVEKFRRQYRNTLFLDAGDQYQGTMWFTMLDWEPIAKYMNLIKYDAMCLGNHDFDHGVSGLVPFLANITCKVVDSNIYSVDPKHPSPLEKYFQKYLLYTFVDTRGQDQTVAVIGYTISTTPEISSPGPDLGFSDEIPALQKVVDQLKAKGINRIIALGHSGINMDRKVCRNVKGLDLVIGGHTNTFLYTGQPPINQTPEGPYPEVYRDTGENCLVVQAYAYGQYLGFLQVNFDENGQINRWNGNPILIDSKIPENPEMVRLLEPYSKRLVDLERRVIGMTEITVNTIGETCKRHECPTANGVADAFVEYYRNLVSNESNSSNSLYFGTPNMCIINSGGLREVKIEKGQNLTIGDLHTLMPFSDTIQRIKLKGSDILAAMERSVENLCEDDTQGKFLQMSGLKVKFDLSKPNFHRVVDLLVSDVDESSPATDESYKLIFKPIDLNHTYLLVTNSYLIDGGNGYWMIKKNLLGQDRSEISDVDVLTWYLKRHGRFRGQTHGRITFVNDETKLCQSSSSSSGPHLHKMYNLVMAALAVVVVLVISIK